jgi:hypothetical protein
MIGEKIDVVKIIREYIYVVQNCLCVLDSEEDGNEFGFEDVKITQEFGSNIARRKHGPTSHEKDIKIMVFGGHHMCQGMGRRFNA